MSGEGPSRTARMATVARAMHLFQHGPRALLADWLAWPLVGAAAERIAAGSPAILESQRDAFMTWFAVRARVTEDWLAASGAREYVILGAGLDSFAWRQAGNVRVFKVDRPETQTWKDKRVAALGLPVPDQLVRVPFDFERQHLGEALAAAGVDHAEGMVVSWLGVVPYLTESAIAATLRELPPCSLSLAYVPPEYSWAPAARPIGNHFQAQVRELGEPWISLLTRDRVEVLLGDAGFTVIDDFGADEVEGRYGLPAVHHERIALARRDR